MVTGFLYFAVVLDVWSRRIVGSAFSADFYTCHQAMVFEEVRHEGMPLPESVPACATTSLCVTDLSSSVSSGRDQSPQARMA
jgi:hypothetical protein